MPQENINLTHGLSFNPDGDIFDLSSEVILVTITRVGQRHALTLINDCILPVILKLC